MRTLILALTISTLCGCAPVFADTGKASWYSTASCQKEGNSGVKTASGERYDEKALTCALPNRRFGQKYKVTNLDNGKSVIVRHNDFGPGKKPRRNGVIVDLSPAAFDALGATRGYYRGVPYGMANVAIEAVSK